jgi:hypothetical protein
MASTRFSEGEWGVDRIETAKRAAASCRPDSVRRASGQQDRKELPQKIKWQRSAHASDRAVPWTRRIR